MDIVDISTNERTIDPLGSALIDRLLNMVGKDLPRMVKSLFSFEFNNTYLCFAF